MIIKIHYLILLDIEGNNIMEGHVNVIVADGFTGNIALKTAEGTSNLLQLS